VAPVVTGAPGTAAIVSASERPAARLPYMPGVDGLRALAVAAVFIFHAGATWLPGGFLGVDVFLVISGYLITALLLAEQRRSGRIDLKRFWIRRVRRLIPALLVMIGGTLTAMVILHSGEVARLKGAVLSSLGYVTNWYFVVADVPYFQRFERPNVFLHLWSLAVEEQFYLLWPMVAALVVVVIGLRPWVLGLIAFAGVVASTWWGWHMYDPYELPWRIYYGTDTRAVGLLVGVVGAILLSPARLTPIASRLGRVLLDVVGLLALAGVLWCMVRIDEFNAPLYQGGFLKLSVATIVLIVVVAHPSSLAGRAFGWSVLVWIGARSYGIYLWHWPVLMLTRPGQDVGMSGAPLLTIQFALAVGIAALSYRYVEMPIRRNGMAGLRAALSLRRARVRERPWVAIVAWGVVGAVIALIVVVAVLPEGPATIPGLGGR